MLRYILEKQMICSEKVSKIPDLIVLNQYRRIKIPKRKYARVWRFDILSLGLDTFSGIWTNSDMTILFNDEMQPTWICFKLDLLYKIDNFESTTEKSKNNFRLHDIFLFFFINNNHNDNRKQVTKKIPKNLLSKV
jgi:hypothetical protein